jgi:putative copper resistance protein D
VISREVHLFVFESTIGIGLFLVLAVLIPRTWSLAPSLVGAVLIAVSYTRVGHSLGEPRWILASLLTMHLLAAAYWVAALEPLRRGARLPGTVVLHRFGRIASVTVAALVIVGAVFAYLLVGDLEGLVSTAYGWTLLAKVAVVGLLLGLAALNKLRLVPAMERGDADAPARLRRSIAWEMAAVAAILVATATLTSITTPPVNLR